MNKTGKMAALKHHPHREKLEGKRKVEALNK